jgi:hypothetical protein
VILLCLRKYIQSSSSSESIIIGGGPGILSCKRPSDNIWLFVNNCDDAIENGASDSDP